jgi:hypothetical protein
MLSNLHLNIGHSLVGFPTDPPRLDCLGFIQCPPFAAVIFGVEGFFPAIYDFVLGFRRGLNEVFALLRRPAALIGNYLPTFGDGLSVRLSRNFGKKLPVNAAECRSRAKT